jgi:hypothetical protein
MKRIINIFLVPAMAALLFIACEDYNERNFPGMEEKEQVKNVVSYDHEVSTADITTIVNALRAKKTPADSAMANALNSAKAFSSKLPSEELVPYLLTATYRGADINSKVRVTFPYVNDYVTKLASAGSYIVSAADYATVWGDATNFFTPGNAPAAKLPAILQDKFPDAVTDDVKVVRYNYSENEPAGISTTVHLSDGFDSYSSTATISLGGWGNVATAGTKNWLAKSYSSNWYAEMSAYSKEVGEQEPSNIAYLITPEIDLSATTNNKMSFDVEVRNVAAGTSLKVLISEDAAAQSDPANVTWDDVTDKFNIPPDFTNNVFVSSGEMSLASYQNSIYVAFKYEGGYSSAATATTTFRIDNVLVKGSAAGATGPEPNPQPYHAVYTYNGTTWAPYSDIAVALNPADYDAMGVASLTATTAPNYLSNFLAAKFPYAQEGAIKAVVYGGKTGNPGGNAAEYQYKAGAWTPIKVTEPYALSPTGWVFDPTYYHTMVAADHKMMVDYMKDTKPELVVASYENEEFYYGFGNRYSNLSFRLSYRIPYAEYDPELTEAATNEDKLAILYERSKEGMRIFCEKKFPNAEEFVSGVQQFYKITVVIHSPNDGVTNENANYEYTFKSLGNGAFEFVEYQLK